MRKFPGALCKGRDGRTYVAVYNYQHDVYTRPSANMKGLERLAHVTYSKGNEKGGIDYFLIAKGRNPEEVARIKKDIQFKKESSVIIVREDKKAGKKQEKMVFPNNLPFVDNSYDIQEEILSLPQEIKDELYAFSRMDIMAFCGFNFAKNIRGPRRDIVDRITPKTRLRKINPEKVLRGGKQWFVPQCILTANIDFGLGCISGFVPEEGAFFDGEFFNGFFSMPTGECSYCYSQRQHKSFPKTVYQFDKQRLLDELKGNCRLEYNSKETHGRQVDVLRFGKRTESWTPFTHDEFMQTLAACAVTGTRLVIPTKFLPYLPEVASLLKRTNSVLLYSIGWDELEQGAVMQGKTNRYRVEQLKRYREDGVNAIPYLMIHAHLPPGHRERAILDLGYPIQLLPLRTKGRKQTKELTGERWEDLVYNKPQGLLDFNDRANIGTHVRLGQSTILPKVTRIHSFWQNLVRDNNRRIRMCHHDDEYVLCGGCFQSKGLIERISK